MGNWGKGVWVACIVGLVQGTGFVPSGLIFPAPQFTIRCVGTRCVVANAKAHNLKEDAKTAATDTGVKKTDNEHGHLKVTSLKMVSESCSK